MEKQTLSSGKGTGSPHPFLIFLKREWYKFYHNYPFCGRYVCGNLAINGTCSKLDQEEFLKCHRQLINWGKFY
jgi:hypothetical protein